LCYFKVVRRVFKELMDRKLSFEKKERSDA